MNTALYTTRSPAVFFFPRPIGLPSTDSVSPFNTLATAPERLSLAASGDCFKTLPSGRGIAFFPESAFVIKRLNGASSVLLPMSIKSRIMSAYRVGFSVINTGTMPFLFAYTIMAAAARPFPTPVWSPMMNAPPSLCLAIAIASASTCSAEKTLSNSSIS